MLHAVSGILSITSSEHFDKSMTLVLIDNTCLYNAKASKNITQFSLGAASIRLVNGRQLGQSTRNVRNATDE